MNQVINTWDEFFQQLKQKQYFNKICSFLSFEYNNYVCFPEKDLLFNSFQLTPLSAVKIVILGQDPYHELGQAMGLAFSVSKGKEIPPSLRNIFKEIENEFHFEMDKTNGDLTYLARQGVLLLNSILSVREHQPLSHNIPEYHTFIVDVLSLLEKQEQPIVYMLWGNSARRYSKFIHNQHHLVLESNHPSPLSANRGGWFGNDHFRKANEYLISLQKVPISWKNN